MAYDLAVAIGVSFSVFAFTFAYLAIHIDEEHGWLRWFFLFLTFIVFGMTIVALAEAANEDAATNIESFLTGGGLHLFIWPFIFIIFYFIIYFIWVVFSKAQSNKNPQNKWRD